MIAAKYPIFIPCLYRTVLDKRTELSRPATRPGLVRAKLPEKAKFDLLRHAVEHKQLEHRLVALETIRGTRQEESPLFCSPPSRLFPWTSPGSTGFAGGLNVVALAFESDDPRVWAAVGKAIKSARPSG